LVDYEYLDTCRSVFAEMHETFKGRIFLKINTSDEHPLLKEIESQNSQPLEVNAICDKIFALYVEEFFKVTNKQYFIFLVKFVTLFRECINNFRKSEDPNLDYTQNETSDNVPDLCNEFITEFMENNDNFGLDPNEVIETIQHFCYWLYENKFTSSRLTLLG